MSNDLFLNFEQNYMDNEYKLKQMYMINIIVSNIETYQFSMFNLSIKNWDDTMIVADGILRITKQYITKYIYNLLCINKLFKKKNNIRKLVYSYIFVNTPVFEFVEFMYNKINKQCFIDKILYNIESVKSIKINESIDTYLESNKLFLNELTKQYYPITSNLLELNTTKPYLFMVEKQFYFITIHSLQTHTIHNLCNCVSVVYNANIKRIINQHETCNYGFQSVTISSICQKCYISSSDVENWQILNIGNYLLEFDILTCTNKKQHIRKIGDLLFKLELK